ncbi:MAG: glycosyltransferase family 2 protein [Acidocella sp.]|uniref:glycosyltransferase family 2 protein n=1 Tax=Acidocella sp. TaxID=50710 RepID=UPI003FC5C1C5
MAGVAVIIPTLNEAEAIGAVIAELPKDVVNEIIVADSGSTDGTQEAASLAGARVLDVRERGYGRACAAAAAAASPECDIIVFMDGDGADRADLIGQLIAPLRAGTHDFVIASRVKELRERGSMSAHQVFAGHALGFAIGYLTGVHYTDMCAYRAIRRAALERLAMREMTYGWNIEMQFKVARLGMSVLELPLPYRCRAGGAPKVAGSLRGTVRASWRILAAFTRLAFTGGA